MVLEDNLSIPGLAFENTARRLNGEKIEFLDLDNVNQKNSVRKIIGNFLNRKNQNN